LVPFPLAEESSPCYPSPLAGEGQGGGSSFHQLFPYDFLDRLNLHQYLIIPESQNAKPLRLEPRCALSIISRLFSMLPSVQFNNQLLFKTDKIYNIRCDRLLSSKPVSSHLLHSQVGPQSLFGFRWIFPESSRKAHLQDSPPPSPSPIKGEGKYWALTTLNERIKFIVHTAFQCRRPAFRTPRSGGARRAAGGSASCPTTAVGYRGSSVLSTSSR